MSIKTWWDGRKAKREARAADRDARAEADRARYEKLCAESDDRQAAYMAQVEAAIGQTWPPPRPANERRGARVSQPYQGPGPGALNFPDTPIAAGGGAAPSCGFLDDRIHGGIDLTGTGGMGNIVDRIGNYTSPGTGTGIKD